MKQKVLALIENTIGTSLLLSTRLKLLGYKVTIVFSPFAFRKRIEADSFDWIILDAAALPLLRQRFVEYVARRCKGARVVWCGESPPQPSLLIEARFAKPLQYNEISRFFSQWTGASPPNAPASADRMPGSPAVEARGHTRSQEEEREKPSAPPWGAEAGVKGDDDL